jgi:hypothetical protein
LGDAIRHGRAATHSRSEFLRRHLSSKSRPHEQIAALRKRHTTGQQCMTPRVWPRPGPSHTRFSAEHSGGGWRALLGTPATQGANDGPERQAEIHNGESVRPSLPGTAALTCRNMAPKNRYSVRSAPVTGTAFGSGVSFEVHVDLIREWRSAALRGWDVVLPLSTPPWRMPPLERLAGPVAKDFSERCDGSSSKIVGLAGELAPSGLRRSGARARDLPLRFHRGVRSTAHARLPL